MDERMRVADRDRQRVADRLRRAQDEGRLDLYEYDERLAAAYAARTYADLGALTADLPDAPVAQPGGGVSRTGRPLRGWALARRIEGAAWLSAGLLNVAIWALVSLAEGGGVYPWWIWVVGPWGIALLVQRLVARALPARSPGDGPRSAAPSVCRPARSSAPVVDRVPTA